MKNSLPAIVLASCLSLSAAAASVPAETSADERPSLFRLGADVRADWQLNSIDGHTDKSNTGFTGKYLMVRIDGEIIPGLSYSWRQRLNKFSADSRFFDATDWLYINYNIGRWNFQAGKEVAGIGGWEYDAYPLDIYSASLFWNNINCFQFGVSAAFDITARDRIMAQVTQSPFWTRENRDMYSYNLMWLGKHGIFEALYSANLAEYADGKYISYISLGNRFKLGPVTIDVDLMNRAASHQQFLFKDVSVVGQVDWQISPRWKVAGKVTYDVNKSGTDADMTVLSGTEMTMAGAHVEYFPLLKDKHRLRLHAGCWYGWGTNANAADLMQDKTLFISTGITWNMDLLDVRRK